jgi:hypothetical protein
LTQLMVATSPVAYDSRNIAQVSRWRQSKNQGSHPAVAPIGAISSGSALAAALWLLQHAGRGC